MATYYSNWTSVSNPCIKLRMKIVTSYSQNKSANTSYVTVKQYIERANYIDYIGGGSHSGSSSNHKLNFSGTTYTDSGTNNYSSNGTTLIQTRSKTISHNSSGEGSFSIGGSCSANVLTDYGYGKDVSLSISTKTISLPTINRTSTITSNATATTKFGDTITFSISRQSSNFTHKISYKMYEATGEIASAAGTSQSWTIPTSLIASTPNNAKPTITITCITYNGTTKIGSDTYSFACNVPDNYVPTCSLVLSEDGTIPSGWNIWVKGKSRVTGVVTAAGSGESTIINYSSKANDEIYTTSSFTTSLLKYNGERTATATVKDSRGRTATASQTIQVVDYFTPTIVMCKVERCTSTGTLSNEGTYAKCTIQYKISPVNNLNTKTLKVTYGSVTKTATASNYEGTYTFDSYFSGIELNGAYNFEFSIVDSFETVNQDYTLPPAYVTISKLAGGKGVTFGQIATEEGLISHMPTKLYDESWAKELSIDGLKTEKVQGGWITYAED